MSGLAVRVRRVEGPPLVAIRVWLRGGSRAEAIPGQAWVAGRMLLEGSRRADWREVARRAESRGLAITSGAARDVQHLAFDGLSSAWQRGLEWAAEQVLEPAWPADRLSWVAEQAAGELASQRDDPEIHTGWAFLDHLYRPHPAGRPLLGDERSLVGLEVDQVAAHHRASLGRGAIVAVAGRIDVDAIARRVEALFGSAAGAGAAAAPPPPRGVRRRRRVLRLAGADQAHLCIGRVTATRDDPALPALRLLGVVLGSGAAIRGRIPERLRDREGLAYVVYVATAAGAGLDPGRLEIYLATAPSGLARAERAVGEELERLAAGGLAAGELEEARTYLEGRLPFQRETAAQWADLLAAAELYGQPLERAEWEAERLRAVDRAAVEDAARKLLEPRHLRTTVGIPA